MRRHLACPLALALGLATACRMAPAGAPVPVEGAAVARADLSGAWTGTYRNDRGGGHGTILFDLAAGADTAWGQVEMTFAPALELYGEAATRDDLARRPCTAIDIAVVRVADAVIRGTLAPYWNPACDCRVVSVFEGRLDGDRIAGTFLTRREGGSEALATGRWSVLREAR